MKVTYISDGDVKGSIPDFIKKIFSKGQGEVVSKVNDLLKVWRQSVQSKKWLKHWSNGYIITFIINKYKANY